MERHPKHTSNHARDLQAIDQEELYCSFDCRDVAEAMEDPDISKEILVDIARRLEDFSDIRMIMLEPIVKNEEKPRVTRSSKIQTEQAVPKDFVNFVGLTDASKVKRGFDAAVKRAPTTPKSAVHRALRRVPHSCSKACSRKRKLERNNNTAKTKFYRQSPRSVVEDLEI
jgi:hypothetical protein